MLRRLREPRIWERIVRERLSEPIWLNLASLFVLIFGGFRARVRFDLVIRQQHAWGLLSAADQARSLGIHDLTCVEFGVASGTGLLNLCELAARVTRETGVRFRIIGFDTGNGMPAPRDYRDHPELYRERDYPMVDQRALRARLPANAELILGDIAETVPAFMAREHAPIGFISLDVDYYSSTLCALQLCDAAADRLLPWTIVYVDDIQYLQHNPFQGVLLAISEFNAAHDDRKIARIEWLDHYRLFRRAAWIRCMHYLHVFNHPLGGRVVADDPGIVLTNPYLVSTGD